MCISLYKNCLESKHCMELGSFYNNSSYNSIIFQKRNRNKRNTNPGTNSNISIKTSTKNIPVSKRFLCLSFLLFSFEFIYITQRIVKSHLLLVHRPWQL